MTQQIALGSRLPNDGERNGLPAIAAAVLENPHHMRALLVMADVGIITEDMDEGSRIPRLRVRRIEPVRAADYKAFDQLIRAALSDRNQSMEIPLPAQADLFSLLNPDVTLPEELQPRDAVHTRNVNDDQGDDDQDEPDTADTDAAGDFFDADAPEPAASEPDPWEQPAPVFSDPATVVNEIAEAGKRRRARS